MRRCDELTVAELHALVWQRPLSHLAQEMGFTSYSLLKCCKAYNIPTPSSAYWVRKGLGKTADVIPLQLDYECSQHEVVFPNVSPKSQRVRQVNLERKRIANELPVPLVDDDFTNTHPIVYCWLQDLFNRNSARRVVADSHDFERLLRSYDSFRLRVTSTFLKSIEVGGGSVQKADVRGIFEIKVGQALLKVKIRQKMSDVQHAGIGPSDWTIWPEHHFSWLFPTRDLKFTLTGNCVRSTEFVYSRRELAQGGLQKFIARILATKIEKERQDREKRKEEIQKREQERKDVERRQQEEEELSRWKRFEAQAESWERTQRNMSFIEALRRDTCINDAKAIDNTPLHEWLDWAETKMQTTNKY